MSDATTRARLTRDRTARGGLPAPFNHPPTLGIGDGARCRGCDETVAPVDKLYSVNLLGVLILHFHAECYQSWQTFEFRQTGITERRVAMP